MAEKFKIIVLVFVILVAGVQSARILAYFPTPSISHQVVFRPLTQELARRGHEVIVVTADPVFIDKTPPTNLTEIDVHEISYNNWQELLQLHRGIKDDLLVQVLSIFEKLATTFDLQMQTPLVKNMLKDKDKNYFDLLLLEACNRCLLGFTDKFDAPAILVSSFGTPAAQYGYLGAPTHPLLYPTPGRQKLYNLTIWEKGLEWIMMMGLDIIISWTEKYDHQIMRKNFGEDLPSIKELRKNAHMLFLNEHPIWADHHPVPVSIQYIGGIHQAEEKDLPEDLKNFLDSSKHGVIYVSFGTNVLPSLLPPEKIEIMTRVFSELPYDILWKWDKDTLPGKSKNIRISSWLPQSDLLRHPNVKLFITQGGLQSTDEAIDAGVPLIGIPMLGDQWYNVEKYAYHRIGSHLDISKLTDKDLKESIENIIENKSYKDNIIRLKTLMRSYPIEPLHNAVWWIEHVIKHGGSHLRSPAADMSWIDYYEVKLVFIGITLVGAMLTLIAYILKLTLSFVYRMIKTNTKIKVQ